MILMIDIFHYVAFNSNQYRYEITFAICQLTNTQKRKDYSTEIESFNRISSEERPTII